MKQSELLKTIVSRLKERQYFLMSAIMPSDRIIRRGMVLSDQVSEFGQSSYQKACHPDEKVLKKFSQQMKALTAFHSNEGTTLRKETR
jgi:hypothetical protein